MTPVGTTMLYRVYPPAQRVQVSRILMIPTVIAPAAGPVLGGFLVDQLSWRWVFYVNVPVGILTCIFGLLCLPEQRESATRRFDLAGFLSAGIGLALLMYALSEGSSYGWTSPAILGGIVGGLLILTAFVFIELRTAEPMIELRLLGERLFSTTNLISLFASAGFLGLLYAAPLFLQEARGVSALTSGLTTFPEAIGVVLSTQLVARLYPRVGPRRLLVGGLLGVTITMSLLCLIGLETNLWFMRLLIFLSGFSMAYVFLPVQAAAFANISSASTGQASALYNAQRQLGASLGVALLSAVISAVGPTYLNHSGASIPNINAYHMAFLAAASLTLIAAIIALTVHDRDAASTMKIYAKHAPTEALPEPAIGAEVIS